MRRIGVLSGGGAADDPDAQGYIGAFLQGLQQFACEGPSLDLAGLPGPNLYMIRAATA
jgi:hypothetical protein